MEKDIVLKVGEKVVHLLNQNTGTQAFLTRKGDYFIPLEERIKIAREYGADLFVSLHTDGSFNPQARGSSIYCLSAMMKHKFYDKENTSNICGASLGCPS
jgi:N-acetylmuramoyl-L-alanine amidase